MSKDDVPDSTDWLPTPLSALSAVESALRCQVCKDFFNTPMITSCCHTFCSLCIRRALANDSKCPLCRSTEQELKLRSNWSMEEAVEAFVKARPAALNLARRRGSVDGKTSPKRKAGLEVVEEDVPDSKRRRTSARLSKTRSELAASYQEMEVLVNEEEPETIEIQGTPDPLDEEYVPEPDDGLVACPVCQRRMKDWQVFAHLEGCTGPSPPQPRPKPRASDASAVSTQAQRQNKSLERLPALNYSMLKDSVLRKKMSELGLQYSGSRPLTEKRHKEWVTLWNANCDAAKPKTRAELLRDLDAWERSQRTASASSVSGAQAAAIKNKDFDGAAWAMKHDDVFKDLIADAKRSRDEAHKKKADEQREEPKEATTAELGVPSPVVSLPNGLEKGKDVASSGAELSSVSIPTKTDDSMIRGTSSDEHGDWAAEPPRSQPQQIPGS